ncbi:MAG TPA: hypothetical protein PL001_03800 [Candidatus Kryptobacter bacterium]|nr:hypothetical protein [Candidatus Kryptobacter bacterium]
MSDKIRKHPESEMPPANSEETKGQHYWKSLKEFYNDPSSL